MSQIVFVCTGNTCRSPMCAALYNDRFATTLTATSCGINAYSKLISYEAVDALIGFGVKPKASNDFTSHISQNINMDIVKNAEIIIGVTSAHSEYVKNLFPEYSDKVKSFSRDIFDPYGGDIVIYNRCLEMINEEMTKLFKGD